MKGELGPESRALFDAARAGLGPDEIAVRRMRARIATTIAGGGITIAAAEAHAATTAAATATAGSAVAVKLAIVATIAVGAAAGTAAAIVHHRAAPAARAPIVEVPASPPSSGIAELAPTAVVPAHESPPPLPRAVVARPATISLARETELVDRALAAMSHDRVADALAAIERYDAETTGRGQLAEDAAAIETEARCRLADPRAAEILATFEARWPTSPERERLIATCARHD